MKSKNGIPYDYILRLFEAGENVDETTFYFAWEVRDGEDHYLGYLPNGPIPSTPYWAGYCDVEGGFSCSTAQELFEAPIYSGKSLKDQWNEVIICEIGGIPAPDFIEIYAKEYPMDCE